ncbi:MAG: imidazole glycerol phosphate synthase subunit HisH [Proteobacteria bacterium]|nr:imidazole glycerol phosphate synthase subunit HisH [Pseudomonadota bacterium]
MNDVAVIDYGMGNLRSVAKALEHVAQKDTRVVISNDPRQIMNAARVVFPGQGAMRDCMKELQRLELDAVVRECVKNKPFLGICMGMQVLLDSSEENNGWPGLGIVQGKVLRFADDMTDAAGARLKVPHMGWNQVRQARAHALWQGIPDQSRFYFVHSYYAQPSDHNLVAGLTSYPAEFTSAIARDNVFAVQFHPEKSERHGLALLSNFLHWNGTA